MAIDGEITDPASLNRERPAAEKIWRDPVIGKANSLSGSKNSYIAIFS